MDGKETYGYFIAQAATDWQIRKTFGKNVRRIRMQQGLTKNMLACMCGVSRQHIGRIEEGTADVRISAVQRLADALRVPPAELLEETADWDAR